MSLQQVCEELTRNLRGQLWRKLLMSPHWTWERAQHNFIGIFWLLLSGGYRGNYMLILPSVKKNACEDCRHGGSIWGCSYRKYFPACGLGVYDVCSLGLGASLLCLSKWCWELRGLIGVPSSTAVCTGPSSQGRKSSLMRYWKSAQKPGLSCS